MHNEALKDEMASDADHRLSPCGYFDGCFSWLYKSRSPSMHTGLHPGNVLQDIPVGENPVMAQTFGNQFFRVHGNYQTTDFRTPSWIHPPKAWWRDLTLYALAHFEGDLERLGLYEAIRATCYGI